MDFWEALVLNWVSLPLPSLIHATTFPQILP